MAISINELRIGNLLQVEAFNPTTMEFAKVTSIKPNEIECEDQRGTTLITVLGLNVKDYGIPITHELFEKCGAEETDDWAAKRIRITDYLFIERNAMGGTYLVDKNGMSISTPPLKFLHQLQNVYFNLKGTELVVGAGQEKV